MAAMRSAATSTLPGISVLLPTRRRSRAARRPAVAMLSRLSSPFWARPPRIRSARAASSAMNRSSSGLGGTTTVSGARRPSSGLEAQAAAVGGDLDGGDDLAEGGRPLVEVLDPGLLEQVRAQVAQLGVELGHGVGHRGGGGPGAPAGGVALAQVAELHVHVGG